MRDPFLGAYIVSSSKFSGYVQGPYLESDSDVILCLLVNEQPSSLDVCMLPVLNSGVILVTALRMTIRISFPLALDI